MWIGKPSSDCLQVHMIYMYAISYKVKISDYIRNFNVT